VQRIQFTQPNHVPTHWKPVVLLGSSAEKPSHATAKDVLDAGTDASFGCHRGRVGNQADAAETPGQIVGKRKSFWNGYQ
jgi:hypothetical protein